MMYIRDITQKELVLTVFPEEALVLHDCDTFFFIYLFKQGIKTYSDDSNRLVYLGWYDD